MDNNHQTNPPAVAAGAGRKKIWIGGGVVILLVLGGFFGWQNFWNPEARENDRLQKQYENYLNWEKDYETAMKNDTYGGQTPQETLDMFVEALRAGDTELASKYFVLKEDGKQDQQWIDLLNNIKSENNLERFSNDIEKYDDSQKTSDSYFVFLYRNEDNSLGLQLTMILNKRSGIWKIESL